MKSDCLYRKSHGQWQQQQQKEVSSVHQDCICLIKNSKNCEILLQFKSAVNIC